MAEAALDSVRRELQEFPAAARGEWHPRGDNVERFLGTGTQIVCAFWWPHIFVCHPSLASERALSSRSHVPVPSWGAVVDLFKAQLRR